jgi:wyosine [tRNA(Phe)-imidazoG37] synthetase (radical SAM superfamily)
MEEKKVYIYGPVASRRLGSSLGVDLVPRKVCDYDCVYCQLGATTRKTTRREAYVPSEAVLAQLKDRLKRVSGVDYVTIAGSGEPTLHAELERIVDGIKRMTSLPLAIITNGSLLGDADVAAACVKADLLVPSLDAADEEAFQAVNRPCAGLSLQGVVEGMVSFRERFQGEMWLEVMVVRGVNSSEEHASRLGELIDRIAPERIQLSTVVRPPSEVNVQAVGDSELAGLAAVVGRGAEAVGGLAHASAVTSQDFNPEKIMQMVRRRPCTADDVSKALGVNYTEAMKMLAQMDKDGLLSSRARAREGKTFYQVS